MTDSPDLRMGVSPSRARRVGDWSDPFEIRYDPKCLNHKV